MVLDLSLTAVEWIVAILIVIGIVKLLVIVINKKIWLNYVVKPIYSARLTPFIFFALAGVILYYLLRELTIVQIIACVAFSAMLIGSVFAAYDKELLKFAGEIFRKKFSLWIWLYSLLWLALMVWAAYVMFFV